MMKSKLLENKLFMSLGALLCCALWGISTPIVKMGYAYLDAAHVPSLLLWAGIQFVLAGVLTVGACSIPAKKLVCPRKKNIKGVVVIALLQTVLQYALMYIGLLYTSSVKGAILKSTDVFFIMLLASLVFKQEKLTARKVFACVIAFAGIIIMNLNGLQLDFSLLGDGLVVLGIVAYSLAVVLTRIVAKDEDPGALAGYQMTLGGAVMLIAGGVFGGAIHDFAGLLPIILCLSVLYAVSYCLWTVLLKNHPASKVAIHSFMTPVFGVIFSTIILTEQSNVATVNLICALALVSIGILIWGSGKKED